MGLVASTLGVGRSTAYDGLTGSAKARMPAYPMTSCQPNAPAISATSAMNPGDSKRSEYGPSQMSETMIVGLQYNVYYYSLSGLVWRWD